MNAVQELLERDAGPMPVGGWVLLLGGAGVAAYMLKQRNTSSVSTIIEQVPVPVGAIAAPDNAPGFTTNIYHTNVPGLDALIKLMQDQADAAKNPGPVEQPVVVVPPTPPIKPAPPVTPAPAVPSVPYPGKSTYYGQVNDRVRMIQQRLNAKVGAGLAVDGRFGPLTRAAVTSYQQSKGLLVDGIVGPQTWGSLFS